MKNDAIDPVPISLRGIRISIFSLLLLVVSIGMGELGTRVTGDPFFRWFFPYFGVGFSVWTYVFYYNGRYRFETRSTRLLLFLGLSLVGFSAALLLFPSPNGGWSVSGMILVFVLPGLTELALNRPILRKTPP